MASAFAHAFAAASLGPAMLPRVRIRVVLAGVACSLLPDVDVLGFRLGVPYGDLLGHRGLTHALPFAAGVAALVTPLVARGADRLGRRLGVFLYLFAATASHGLFDALTDGGLGVAFLSPFDPTRYFLPFRPVRVSPLGVAEFFTPRAWTVLASEVVWIALPWTVFCVGIGVATRRLRRPRLRSRR